MPDSGLGEPVAVEIALPWFTVANDLSFHLLSENGVGINDMKDMLASLPEFQETRDKVGLDPSPGYLRADGPSLSVLFASRYGAGMHVAVREEEVAPDGRYRAGQSSTQRGGYGHRS